MSSHKPSVDRGAGILKALLAPLYLPGQVVKALATAAEALQHVGPIQSDVASIRKQSESLDELLPTLESMKGDLAGRLDSLHQIVETLEGVEDHLDTTVDGLVAEIKAIHTRLRDLNDDVERITNRLPESDARGPLERARDAIGGGGR